MRSTVVAILLLILGAGLSGCPSGEGAPAVGPERTRAQRDSLLSTLPIPGAGGVGRALDAAEAASARARQHDTLR